MTISAAIDYINLAMIISERNTSQIINDDICVPLNLLLIICFFPTVDTASRCVGRIGTVAKFLVPDWEDMIDYDIGLSYRPPGYID
jgi:hypothetical protein